MFTLRMQPNFPHGPPVLDFVRTPDAIGDNDTLPIGCVRHARHEMNRGAIKVVATETQQSRRGRPTIGALGRDFVLVGKTQAKLARQGHNRIGWLGLHGVEGRKKVIRRDVARQRVSRLLVAKAKLGMTNAQKQILSLVFNGRTTGGSAFAREQSIVQAHSMFPEM